MGDSFADRMDELWADIRKDVEPKLATLKEAVKLRADRRGAPPMTDDAMKTVEEINEEAANKFVWKTYESLHEWVTTEVLPALYAMDAALQAERSRAEQAKRERDAYKQELEIFRDMPVEEGPDAYSLGWVKSRAIRALARTA